MRIRPVLTTVLILAVSGAVLWVYAGRRAAQREVRIEALHPALGQIVKIAGRDVHVVVRGTGPDLVLIHGAGGSNRDMSLALGERLAADYRVLAFDRPGFGWSERMSDDLDGPFTTASESPIEQARHLAEAARLLGAEAPIVVGHSYGASVAMGWALEEDVSAVVVISGATMPWPGEVDWTYRVLGSRPGGALLPALVSAFVSETYVQAALDSVFAPDLVPGGYLSQTGVMMSTRVETLRANARQVNTLRPHVVAMSARYGEVSLPVEILHGTADRTVFAEVHARPLAALLPDANLTILEGVGHMPHHSAPDAVVDAINRAAARAGLR